MTQFFSQKIFSCILLKSKFWYKFNIWNGFLVFISTWLSPILFWETSFNNFCIKWNFYNLIYSPLLSHILLPCQATLFQCQWIGWYYYFWSRTLTLMILVLSISHNLLVWASNSKYLLCYFKNSWWCREIRIYKRRSQLEKRNINKYMLCVL